MKTNIVYTNKIIKSAISPRQTRTKPYKNNKIIIIIYVKNI